MMIWWIAIGFISRLIIHIPDATPITTLALLAPSFFSLRQSLLMILSVLFISDLWLHFLCHYPILGSWSFFNFSGWCGVVLLGNAHPAGCASEGAKKIMSLIIFSIGASFLFWVWTNFGTWCTTTLYSHTISGLMTCYYAALPFLRNSMIGTVCWSGVIISILRSPSYQLRTEVHMYTQIIQFKDMGNDAR
jgi:hypothetical protein